MESNSISLKDVWAKTDPFQSIMTHATLSGLAAQMIWEKLPEGVREELVRLLSSTQEQGKAWLGYLVSLHDIGKVEELFQWQWPEMRARMEKAGKKPEFADTKVRHERTTVAALNERIWKELGAEKSLRSFYAGVLGAHHQGKDGKGGSKHTKNSSFWNGLQAELEETMRHLFLKTDVVSFPPVEKPQKGPAGALLLGLTILSDWIASGDLFADAETWFDPEKTWAEAEQKVERFLEDSGLCGSDVDFGREFSEVWPNIPRGGLRGLQEDIESLFAETKERISVVLIEAPMGEGKTEAGIYAALQMARQWKKHGFYVGLPTSATSNQMVGRMREFLALHGLEDTVRLLHSMAWLVDEDLPEMQFDTEEKAYAARWLLPVRRGLLAPYAVGTVDQAMMAVLMVKYGVLRLLGLAQKTLVIDELHSYDVYMSELIERLLEWCKALEIPVVMLSATLPPEKKAQMLSPYTTEKLPQDYPAITAITEDGRAVVRKIGRTEKHSVVSVSLCPILQDPEQIARKAAELVQDGGCLCVLLNAVDQAQTVYQALKQMGFDGETLLFHARFPAEWRQEIEAQCIRWFGKDKSHRPKKAILVATQVVEQSLDVDFDAMMTAVAPIDLLLQRVGRVFRHEDTPRPPQFQAPTLCVLTPQDPENYHDVYPPCLRNQSIHLLQDQTAIRIPDDMPQLVVDGYDMTAAPPEELEHWMEHLMENEAMSSASTQYLIRSPGKGFSPMKTPESIQFDDLEQSGFLSAKTRLGPPTKRIVLLEEEAFRQLAERAKKVEGIRILDNLSKNEEKDLLKQSVSIQEKKLEGKQSSTEVLYGRKRLEGLWVLRGEQKDGTIFYHNMKLDHELGIRFQP